MNSYYLPDKPLFIMLTFSDAQTNSMYDTYFRPLLVDNEYELYNPSGCRTKSTLYVSRSNTNYSALKAILEAGNEIGYYNTHPKPQQGEEDDFYQGVIEEIRALKEEMLKATRTQMLLYGFRSPYVARNVQFDVLRDFGFLYDTSMKSDYIFRREFPLWPFTLDFLMEECINPPCPTKPYPGLWEVPINSWLDDRRRSCSMIDDCTVGLNSLTATEQQWYNFYFRNFEEYFYTLKLPMLTITDFSYTRYPNAYNALIRLFQNVLKTYDNVWLVTPIQVIKWMQNRMSNAEMIAQKWGC